jgi:hypothetical protein
VQKNTIMKNLFLSTLALIAISTSAQNVGINSNGANPDPSSILDVASADKGLLIPRVNIADLTTIAPITGGATTSLMVYNTNVGTGLGYFYWDGNDWIKLLSGGNVDNGLYFNGAAQRIRLGGPLVEATTITQGTNAMTFNLNSTGDFNVQDNGTTRFQVLDNGRIEMSGTNDASGAANTGVLEIANSLRIDGNEMITNTATTLYLQNDNNGDLRVDNSTLMVDASLNRVGVRTTAPTYELDVVGNIGHNDFMYHNDDADTYLRFPAVDQIRMYAGNVRMMDMVEGGTDYVVFNENSADVDFRIESNNQTNVFRVDAGSDAIGFHDVPNSNTLGGSVVDNAYSAMEFGNDAGGGNQACIGWWNGPEVLIVPESANYGYVGNAGNYWYYMYSNNFVNVSRRETKRDFVKIDENQEADEYLMSAIDNMSTYFYKYKAETDSPKEGMSKYRPQYHLGVIVDESPDVIKDAAFSGVDIYALGALALTGVKHNREEIKNLKSANVNDFGSVILNGNQVEISFSDEFVNSMDENGTPVVTVTPISESDLTLTIISKTSNGFIVKCSEEVSNLNIDWIAFAKPKLEPVQQLKGFSDLNSNLINKLEISDETKAKMKEYHLRNPTEKIEVDKK